MATTIPTTRTTTNKFVWFAPESEFKPYFDLRQVDNAYRQCRKHKRNKVRTCYYEQQLLDNLLTTSQQLQNQTWQPQPQIVFTVAKPKAREIYAAQFADRVVHHALMNVLNSLLEQEFIFDSAANRKNKGTHFAVERLMTFMKKNTKAWFLQLDVANFFNQIKHDVLFDLLERKLAKWLKKGKINGQQQQQLVWLSRQIICQPPTTWFCQQAKQSSKTFVPEHKRLTNMPNGQGLPIGNLTSQAFANLYLNELDQFVKHQLKCKHYIRYVDDFVLCHPDPEQLKRWHQQIAAFLITRLSLSLKPQYRLAPVTNGADFLGYIIRPHYKLVRRRVLGNLHEKLQGFHRLICKTTPQGRLLDLHPNTSHALYAMLSSYWGHFKHANSFNLTQKLFKQYAWLNDLFCLSEDHKSLIPFYKPKQPLRFKAQIAFFCQFYPAYLLLIQCGMQIYVIKPNTPACTKLAISRLTRYRKQLAQQGIAYLLVTEQGFNCRRSKIRAARLLFLPSKKEAPPSK